MIKKDAASVLLATFGLLMLVLAVMLDKHSLGLKTICSLLAQLAVLTLAFLGGRRRLIAEKRFILYILILGSAVFYFFLFVHYSLWESPKYIQVMYTVLSQIPATLMVAAYAIIDPWVQTLGDYYVGRKPLLDRVALAAVVLTLGLVFFYSPMTVHASDPESLPFPMVSLLLWHGLFFIVATVLALYFYRTASRSFRAFLAPALAVAALVVWIYTYLIPGDYGVLDVALFSQPGRLIGFHRLYGAREKWLQIAEILVLAVTASGLYWMTRKFTRQAMFLLVLLNLMTLGQTAANIIAKPGLWSAGAGGTAYLPENTSTVYRLSREKNVLLIMMDMFSGGLVPRILDEYPYLEDSLQGFTWYPNTVSLGTATFAGLPGILGGEEFAPYVVNQNPGIPMSKRLSAAYSVYPEAFNAAGYETVFMNPVYYNLEEEAEERNITVVPQETFAEYWIANSPEAENLDLRLHPIDYASLFSVVGLFKASPHFLRPYIYTEGRWLNLNRGTLHIRSAINNLSFLNLLTKLSSVDEGPPAFKFLDNEFTHLPWAIDKDLSLTLHSGGGRSYNAQNDFMLIGEDRPYYTAARAMHELAAYFDWMRSQDVFDQTKIVIVSDHGYYGVSPMWPDMPVVRADDETGVEGSAAYQSFLMVKDFGSDAPFAADERLMSTVDTNPIVLSALGDEEAIANDPTRGAPDPNRTVYTTLTPVPPEENGKDSYVIQYLFSITDDPSRRENWTQVIP